MSIEVRFLLKFNDSKTLLKDDGRFFVCMCVFTSLQIDLFVFIIIIIIFIIIIIIFIITRTI